MSQDNIFESPEWQSSGNYGKFDDLATIQARRTFSRFFLAIFIFLITANLVVFGLSFLIMLIMGSAEYQAFLESSPIYEMLMGTLPMYLTAFPILCHLVHESFFLVICRFMTYNCTNSMNSSLFFGGLIWVSLL